METTTPPQVKNAKFFCGKYREKYLFIMYKSDEELKKSDFPETITVDGRVYSISKVSLVHKRLEMHWVKSKIYIATYFSVEKTTDVIEEAAKWLESFFIAHRNIDLF